MNRFLHNKIPKGKKLFVISDVHEHEEQFDKALEYFNSRDDLIFVSVGDLLEKGFGCAESIVSKIKTAADKTHQVYIVKGNHELKAIRNVEKENKKLDWHLKWLKHLPLSLSFEFCNGSRVTVVHGGVRPCHTWEDLVRNIEVCYARLLDKKGKLIKMKKKIVDGKKIFYPAKPNGKVWHEKYDGRFGYIISGHNSQKDGIPKFYDYSCNIDTACYHTGKLTAIIYGAQGREDLLTFEGTARFPDLDQMMIDMAQGRV